MEELKDEDYNKESVSKKEMRKYYAGAGWRLLLAGIAIVAIQYIFIIIFAIINKIFPNVTIDSSFQYIMILIGDLCGIGVFALSSIKRKKYTPEPKKLKFGWWLVLYLVCLGIMGIGSIIGLIVSAVILLPWGYSVNDLNAATNLLTSDLSWPYVITGALVAGIIVPILEETLFRKLLMDNMLKYGKGAAILCSGLFFGLFHGNFSQFFYAFGLGIVLAYIYACTGKVKYTIFIHMAINFLASGFMMFFMKLIDFGILNEITALYEQFVKGIISMEFLEDKVTQLLIANPLTCVGAVLLALYVVFYYGIMLIGLLVMIIFAYKFFKFRKNLDLGEKGSKPAAVFNWGSILFIGFTVIMFASYYLAQIIPRIAELVTK